MPVRKHVHEFQTWEVYPRIHYFQKRIKDLYARYKRITNDGAHPSIFNTPGPTEDLLETLSSQLDNYLQVIIVGRKDLDPEKFVISTDALGRHHVKGSKTSTKQRSSELETEQRLTIVICYSKIDAYNSKNLQVVKETLAYFASMKDTSGNFVIPSPIVACETKKVKQRQENVSERDQFCSEITTTAMASFNIDVQPENIVLDVGQNILGSKISDILEYRIIQGFLKMSQQLQDFIGDRCFAADTLDILESDQLMDAIQNFLKNGLGFVDILETKKEDESFIETLLNSLVKVIRCAVIAPMSAKYSLPQDTCNHVAYEFHLDYKLKQSVSKNTRYHLSKLEKPCNDMIIATKAGNKAHQFPGRNFLFIAYPLREDIKKTLESLESTLKSVQRTADTMRKMLHEVGGYIFRSIWNREGDFTQVMTRIPENVREEVMKISGVYGMGTFYGRREIHLMKMENEKRAETLNSICEVMDRLKFRQPYRVVSVLQEPKQFCFETGRRIECECNQKSGLNQLFPGTLGGFARSGDDQVYVLTCAHVVHGQHETEHDVFIKKDNNSNSDNDKRLFARSRPEMTIFPIDQRRSLIDIAAVRVLQDEDKRRCSTCLKTDDGNVKTTELFTDAADDLIDADVYKFGASSGLTKGMICSTDFSVHYADVRDHLVLIDQLPGSDDDFSYAVEGDSGSINCMVQLNGHTEVIKAVSMLCAGKYRVDDSNLCMSFLLRKGIEKLKEAGGVDLQLNTE